MSFDIAPFVATDYICPSMMQKPAPLHEVLFVSTIAPEAPISIVAQIAGKARIANKARDITGLLIFDGMRFCEQLEGIEKDILALLERIRQDPRHTSIKLLHHGPLAERRFKRFSMGYALVEDVEVLGRLEQLEGQAAVDAFVEILSTLDLDS